jgi:hypothetical protein
MFAAKLVLSQSTQFKLHHQPLDLLPASSFTPRNFLAFTHPDITALKRGADLV